MHQVLFKSQLPDACKLSFCTLLLTLLVAGDTLADTVYIRDTLYVPLRGGQSVEHRILHRGLKSGTELERLEINEDSGYSRVKTSDGLEGWLQTQYLVETPVAAILLEDAVGQLEKLEADHQQALLRLREAREVSDELTAAEAAMQQEIDRLNNELQAITDLAANTISIDEENRQLNEGRDALLGQIDALIEENDSLGDNRAQEWFLRGAGTILLGLLFGFWIGRRIYHRRNTGGWA